MRKVQIKTCCGKFVTAQDGGKKPLCGGRDVAKEWETFDLSFVPTTSFILSSVVTLKSHANGMYVCSQQNGQKPLIANREQAKQWQQFQIIPLGQNKYHIKSVSNGKYVGAQDAGKGHLIANRDVAKQWQVFTIIDKNY